MKDLQEIAIFFSFVVVFLTVTFFVAWGFKDITFFSLFVGFPIGFISAIVVSVLLIFWFNKRSLKCLNG
ncbi:MAG: hypothetical protein KKG04_01145 [Candidatus Thermoplasmatota archaeon]|nr:hypothetical protein [Candidatus Thermoplasmatota archaeon]